jgi:cob(I)alamin adenosyltransferase
VKIYTRTGDAGETSLFGGGRVGKDHGLVEAYGTVDELNACIGFARAMSHDQELIGQLADLQDRLLVLGADLATPMGAKARSQVPTVPRLWIDELEADIDAMTAELPALDTFVRPSGPPGAAALHIARTVCRRAERRAAAAVHAGENVSADALAFLNRLADWLFTAARWAAAREGFADDPWRKPGAG